MEAISQVGLDGCQILSFASKSNRADSVVMAMIALLMALAQGSSSSSEIDGVKRQIGGADVLIVLRDDDAEAFPSPGRLVHEANPTYTVT